MRAQFRESSPSSVSIILAVAMNSSVLDNLISREQTYLAVLTGFVQDACADQCLSDVCVAAPNLNDRK